MTTTNHNQSNPEMAPVPELSQDPNLTFAQKKAEQLILTVMQKDNHTLEHPDVINHARALIGLVYKESPNAAEWNPVAGMTFSKQPILSLSRSEANMPPDKINLDPTQLDPSLKLPFLTDRLFDALLDGYGHSIQSKTSMQPPSFDEEIIVTKQAKQHQALKEAA